MSDEKIVDQKDKVNNLEKDFIKKKSDDSSREVNGREILKKENFSERSGTEKDSSYYQILKKVKKKSKRGKQSGESVVIDAKKISQQTDAESQINNLVDLATKKGVVYAVKVAKHLDDNYVLDKLHDSLLVDKLRKSLIEKGIIKDY